MNKYALRILFLHLILSLLTACTTSKSGPQPVTIDKPTASIEIGESTSADAADSTDSSVPVFTVTVPSQGQAIPIGQPITFSGRMQPPPTEDITMTAYFAIEGGTHPNFDFTTIDKVTGDWAIETQIHPQHIGPAHLILAANAGPNTAMDAGGATEIPVQLVYDQADGATYINITSPIEMFPSVEAGSRMKFQGSAHNPINGNVEFRVTEYDTETPISFDEILVSESGTWETVLTIPADWAGQTLLVDACTKTEESNNTGAWCSTKIITVLE